MEDDTREEDKKLAEAAQCIADWMYGDGHINVDIDVLMQQLQDDLGYSGRIPTEEECELLVTGGDEGDAFVDLGDQYFPSTCAFLASYYE